MISIISALVRLSFLLADINFLESDWLTDYRPSSDQILLITLPWCNRSKFQTRKHTIIFIILHFC